MIMTVQHFLEIKDIDAKHLRKILELGNLLRKPNPDFEKLPLAGKFLACIFEKPSTRTRISFDVGMKKLGGEVVFLSPADSQLGRSETIADTARVLSRYVDAMMIRTDDEAKMLELAKYATVPVINGLTDKSHPCQIMADIMTCEQHKGNIQGKKIAWVGDGNNMTTSWIHAAVKFDFELSLACPAELSPSPSALQWARDKGHPIEVTSDPLRAVKDADFVTTDVWVSMSDEKEGEHAKAQNLARHNYLKPFQVNQELMQGAKQDALFLHCLPAHRGEEVTAEVIDGDNSVVWDEAENRLHAQKGILLYCLQPHLF